MKRVMSLLDLTNTLTPKPRSKTISITNSLSTTTDGESQQEHGSLRLRKSVTLPSWKTDLPLRITITIVVRNMKSTGLKIKNSPMSLTALVTPSCVRSLSNVFSESKEHLLIQVINSSHSFRHLAWTLIQHSTLQWARLFMKTKESLSGPASGKHRLLSLSDSSPASTSLKCMRLMALLLSNGCQRTGTGLMSPDNSKMLVVGISRMSVIVMTTTTWTCSTEPREVSQDPLTLSTVFRCLSSFSTWTWTTSLEWCTTKIRM